MGFPVIHQSILQIFIVQERVGHLKVLAVAQATGIDGVSRCRQGLQVLPFASCNSCTIMLNYVIDAKNFHNIYQTF